MSRCLAFNQKGRPCCNYGSVVSSTEDAITYAPTCHAHRNYFKSKKNVENWKFRIVRSMFWYSYRYDIFISKKNIVDILLAALASGVISLKRTDLLVDETMKLENSVDYSGYVTSRIAPYIK